MSSSRRRARPARAGLAVAALAALCLSGAAAGAAGAPAAGAPVEEEPVQFGESGQDAPELTTGVYEVEAPQSDQERYLAVEREVEGSTLWLAETLVSGGEMNGYMYLSPSVDGTSGGECGDGATVEGDDYRQHRFMTGIMLGTGECETSEAMFVQHRASAASGASFPTGEPMQVVAWEEPPVADPSVLPPPSTSVPWTGEAMPAEGEATLGATYADAPDLTGGRWDVHVDPGVPALFRVDLDWNQHVEVAMSYNGKELSEYVPIEPVLITPIGGRADWAETQGEDVPSFPDVNLGYPGMDGGVVSPVITWRNREKPAESPAAFPGTYYVMLQLGTKDAPEAGADLTVGVNVLTDGEPESPYAEEGDPPPDIGGHGTATSTSGGDGGGDGEAGSSEAAGSGDAAPPWGAVTALFGGSAVFAAAGAVLLGRHRRTGH